MVSSGSMPDPLYERLAVRAPRLAFVLFRPRAALDLAYRRARGLPPITHQAAGDFALDDVEPQHGGPTYRSDLKSELNLVRHIDGARETLLTQPERTFAEREAKIDYLNLLVRERRVDRVRWFAELARLERLQGAEMVAATYDLRIMRWLGGDVFGRLGLTTAVLQANGFEEEASTARSLYAARPERRALVEGALERQRDRWRVNPSPEMACEIIDRRAAAPRVTVVVSLYAAADKLRRFIAMLRQQTLFAAGQVEVIFVDSASPQDERSIILSDAAAGLPFLYIRSAERETIQGAWNRALRHARGDYLIFMGVDEGLRPDGLALLSQALDRDPQANWAMADALVSRVDRRGVIDQDVMLYDRSGYRRTLTVLESTYVAYVAGLYRRKLHDGVGYYDPRFRAAGDTEFKNRALPQLRVARVAETLGVFNDYPDDRMSAHPRAEIEDLRASYLHREPAALSAAFDPEELRELLCDALGYRKSYAGHSSQDVDVACSAALEVARRSGSLADQAVLRRLLQVQRRLRSLELWSGQGGPAGGRLAAEVFNSIDADLDSLHRQLSTTSRSDIFHDNRFEQHHWSWSVRP